MSNLTSYKDGVLGAQPSAYKDGVFGSDAQVINDGILGGDSLGIYRGRLAKRRKYAEQAARKSGGVRGIGTYPAAATAGCGCGSVGALPEGSAPMVGIVAAVAGAAYVMTKKKADKLRNALIGAAVVGVPFVLLKGKEAATAPATAGVGEYFASGVGEYFASGV